MDLKKLEQIKKLAIIAMFSDDELMDKLVLKGGNALDIVYKVESRASLDLDFSMPSEFKPDEIQTIGLKLESCLKKVFSENGYEVFDISFQERPKERNEKTPSFWGGYELNFKVIEKSRFNGFMDPQQLRLGAIDAAPGSQKIFKIDISKWEDCEAKCERDFEKYTIYLYSPEMIVCEKLRAICQQLSEYQNSIGVSTASARARDFFDVYTTIRHFKIDMLLEDNLNMLKRIFATKQVPLKLLTKVEKQKEYHRPDFEQVKNTVKPKVKLKEFDFYFDYVADLCNKLIKALGVI